MTQPYTDRRRSVSRTVTVALAAALVAGAALAASDDFNEHNLDLSRWTFVNPLGDGRVWLQGVGTADARVHLTVPAGVSHDPWTADDAVRIMQPMDDVDLTVEARFDSDVTQAYQIQGIIIEQDAANWLRFDFHYDGTHRILFAASVTGGEPTSRVSRMIGAGLPLFLRVERTGDEWTVSYSFDGASWTVGGSFVQALAVAAGGPFAGNYDRGLAAPPHTAMVDYWWDANAPGGPDDAGPAPPDVTAPFQHRIDPGVADTTLRVRWATDEPASGRMEYGLTTAYELGAVEHNDLSYEHDLTISGLTPETLYHYRILSTDAAGNRAVSADRTAQTQAVVGARPVFDVWYGTVQDFGHIGVPQRWVDVLGNVSDPDGIARLTFSLNGSPVRGLSVGPDGRRLISEGDFDAQIDFAELIDGLNEVRLTVTDTLGAETQETVWVDYAAGNVWPATYTVHWNQASKIQDVAQVVDGLWSLESGGFGRSSSVTIG